MTSFLKKKKKKKKKEGRMTSGLKYVEFIALRYRFIKKKSFEANYSYSLIHPKLYGSGLWTMEGVTR